jgi:RNAse (barnase) inhibitor barstar
MNMKNKVFVLDGNKFGTLDGFCDEAQTILTKDLSWKIGTNLDALNDLFWGGFGAFEHEELIDIVWKNSNKSKSDLGYPETIKWLERKLKRCHPSNVPSVKEELQRAKNYEGPTLFDIIIEIVEEHKHINLILE